MQLTPHFSLAELTASSTARRLGLDNTPSPQATVQLQHLAELLERVRAHLGAPVIVTSGYRSQAVNRAVGGVATSDHVQGRAADVVAPGYGTPLQIARGLAPLVGALGIGQLIYEHVGGKAWVHLSTRVPDRPVNRVITISNAGTQLGIQAA
ncbi:D-Ala-D-Ala carboxypeptidase family metallohydrolase [Melaminivora sp.]|uniref:D-Ala-D-Ala carboxypeptidase family metallohydrolase n=1 Tax=Melaminivora sp. TaxID=1933032 RepID=UPI0028AF8EA9|nr:D-Ala-D-Ala carboxypeptidase family metallohydrolase [Melaminivora sp.]